MSVSEISGRNYFYPNISYTNENNAKISSEELSRLYLLYRTNDPSHVIFKAASAGNLDAVRNLLDYGMKSETTLISPGRFLRISVTDAACISRNIELIKYLMEERKIKPISDPMPWFMGRRPVFFSRSNVELGACCIGEPFFEGIDYFLSIGYKLPAGIIFNAFHKTQPTGELLTELKTDMHHKTDPLPIPPIETIRFLIDRGAKIPDAINRITKRDNPGEYQSASYIWHALLHNLYSSSDSAQTNARKMIKLLLSIGLDPNVRSKYMPYTPYNIQIRTQNSFDHYCSPLGVALHNNDCDLVQLLLDSGADLNQETYYYYWHKNPDCGRTKNIWQWVPGQSRPLFDMIGKDMKPIIENHISKNVTQFLPL